MKSQASSEYLFTYFITLVVIASVGLALYNMGILQPEIFVKKGCYGFEYFHYVEHEASSDRLNLILNNGYKRIEFIDAQVKVKERGGSWEGSGSTFGEAVKSPGEKMGVFVTTPSTGEENIPYIFEVKIVYETDELEHTDIATCTGKYALTILVSDQIICKNAEDGGLCDGLDIVYGEGYEQSCCDEYGICC